MAVEELNGEVKFSTQLPYPNNLSRFRLYSLLYSILFHFPHMSAYSRLLKTTLEPSRLIAVVQNTFEADGSAAAADAVLGPCAARRQSQPRNQEAPLLRSAGADPEYEGKLEPLIIMIACFSESCGPSQSLNFRNSEAVVGKPPRPYICCR